MSERTPGPWVTFNYGGNTGEDDFEGLGVCQRGKSMAVMMGDKNGYVCDLTPSKYQLGNGDLIAAAPELLDALKRIVMLEVGLVSKYPFLAAALATVEGRT